MPAIKQFFIIVIALAIFMPTRHVHLDVVHNNHPEWTTCQVSFQSVILSKKSFFYCFDLVENRRISTKLSKKSYYNLVFFIV